MSKKREGGAGSNNGAIIICNIIIAVLCVVSIVTLLIGDFWKADIKLTVDKDTLITLMGSADSSNGSSDSSEEADNMAVGIKAAEEESTGMTMEDVLKYLDDDFKLEFGISLQLKGPSMAKSAFGQSKEAVQELISDQVNNLVDEVSSSVDNVVNVSIKAVIKMAVEEAKAAIKEELKKQMAESDISEEKMDEELAKEGISLAAIDTMIDNFMDNMGKMLEGDTQSCITFMQTDETLFKVARLACKSDMPSGYTDEELDAKAEAYIDDMIKNYNEMVDSFSIDGEFSSETIVIALLNQTGIMDDKNSSSGAKNAAEEEEASGEKKFQSMDDVKAYIVEKIMGAMGDEAVEIAGTVVSAIGYFLLFVAACWAYVLIKVIIKTIVSKNKTVGLFFPRMFGWMPHVFFVGLPMLLIKHLPEIVANTSATDSQVETTTKILNMFTINVSSLTWISALCSVLLLVLLFFYYPMRRKAKKNK